MPSLTLAKPLSLRQPSLSLCLSARLTVVSAYVEFRLLLLQEEKQIGKPRTEAAKVYGMAAARLGAA